MARQAKCRAKAAHSSTARRESLWKEHAGAGRCEFHAPAATHQSKANPSRCEGYVRKSEPQWKQLLIKGRVFIGCCSTQHSAWGSHSWAETSKALRLDTGNQQQHEDGCKALRIYDHCRKQSCLLSNDLAHLSMRLGTTTKVLQDLSVRLHRASEHWQSNACGNLEKRGGIARQWEHLILRTEAGGCGENQQDNGGEAIAGQLASGSSQDAAGTVLTCLWGSACHSCTQRGVSMHYVQVHARQTR